MPFKEPHILARPEMHSQCQATDMWAVCIRFLPSCGTCTCEPAPVMHHTPQSYAQATAMTSGVTVMHSLLTSELCNVSLDTGRMRGGHAHYMCAIRYRLIQKPVMMLERTSSLSPKSILGRDCPVQVLVDGGYPGGVHQGRLSSSGAAASAGCEDLKAVSCYMMAARGAHKRPTDMWLRAHLCQCALPVSGGFQPCRISLSTLVGSQTTLG